MWWGTLSLASLLVLSGCMAFPAPAESTAAPADPVETSAPPAAPTQAPANATEPAANATEPTGPRPGDLVDAGHIAAGSPTTGIYSLCVLAGTEGYECFIFENAPEEGTIIGTNTTNNGGIPFNLDIYFHTSGGAYLGGCNSDPEGEETCEVPEGAGRGTVDATSGIDLDVRLLIVALPEP